MKTLLLLPPALAAAFALGLRGREGAAEADAPAALATAPVPRAQEPDEAPAPDEFPPGWRGDQLRRTAELTEQLIGYWNLIEFRHATNNLDATQINGFMTIDPEVLTILVQVTILNPGPLEEPRKLQGGAHFWRFDENLCLQTASILSHTNFSGAPEFERQLTPREYEPSISDDELTLRRSDDSLLIFRRVSGLAFPDAAVDIIEAAKAGRDPFER